MKLNHLILVADAVERISEITEKNHMTTATDKTTEDGRLAALRSDAMVKRFWCVMKAHGWDCLTVAGIPVQAPKEGPQHFIPVFDTREQAVAWAGTEEHVYALESVA